jgi:hypothetical protein
MVDHENASKTIPEIRLPPDASTPQKKDSVLSNKLMEMYVMLHHQSIDTIYTNHYITTGCYPN